ncbi:MAG: methylglutaconyl-CoA hydratase, partial [Paracoccaceae bacterium]
RARRVFMSARIFDASEAVDLGLLARAVDAGALDAAIEAEIVPYLACAPGAVADAKALIAKLDPRVTDATVAMTIDALVRRWESEEAQEGIAAFFDKRKANWVDS